MTNAAKASHRDRKREAEGLKVDIDYGVDTISRTQRYCVPTA
jgi:hypothetical protein